MEVLQMLFKVLLFPGFLFLTSYAFAAEYIDRKLHARMQNRKGPKWYIPFADFFKLIGKQTIIHDDAHAGIIKAMPVVSLAGVATAFIYIPVVGSSAVFSFEGDIIIVLYFLSLPVLTQFLAGWYSRSLYATIGASRVITQMFAYEVPLFMCLLAPSLIANTWSVSGITQYYSEHPLYALINLPAFAVALITVQSKLSKAPFDAPEAETEIVSGPYVEYTGRPLAFFRMSADCEEVVLISLVSAIFLPFLSGNAIVDVILYFVKTLAILFVLTLMRTVTARLRVNQTVTLCWRYLVPAALLQMIVNLIVRGWLD